MEELDYEFDDIDTDCNLVTRIFIFGRTSMWKYIMLGKTGEKFDNYHTFFMLKMFIFTKRKKYL